MKLSRIGLVLVLTAFALPVFGQDVQYQMGGFAYQNRNNLWKSGGSVGWQSLAPAGTWWRNQAYVTRLSLTPDQQKKMDEVFQQTRIRLIDLTAALDKEEATLEPLLQADRLDEIKVGAQLDKIADARAELEKAHARMLLSIRQVLTPEQWKMLNGNGPRLEGYFKNIEKSKTLDLLRGKP